MRSTPQLDRFLAAYPNPVRETAWAALNLLMRMLPRAETSIDESARLISFGYGPGYKGLVCTVIMSQTGAKLGIVRGAELPDPKHLMTGSGKLHRHVQLRSAADLKVAGLSRLIKDALACWQKRNAVSAQHAFERTRRR